MTFEALPAAEPLPRTAEPAVSTAGASSGLVRAGFTLAVVAVLIQTFAHLLNVYAFDGAHHALDAGSDGEGNSFTWASSSATLAAGVFAFVLAFVDPPRRLAFGVLAAVLTVFSLDDAVVLHERGAIELVGAIGLDDSWARTAWPVFMFPALAFVALVVWLAAARGAADEARVLRAGLGLLAFAVFAEVALVVVPTDSRLYELVEPIEIAIEEGAELAGWILIAAGLGAVLAGRCRTQPS